MKKNISLLLCLCLIVSLLMGCAAAKQPQAEPDTEPLAATTSVKDGSAGDDSKNGVYDIAKLLAAKDGSIEKTLKRGDALPTVGTMQRLAYMFDEMGLFYDAEEYRDYMFATDDAMPAEAEASAEAPAMDTTAAADTGESGLGGGDYSETNIQVEGVDEADIIKTDGEYIYYSTDGQIVILKPNGDSVEQLALINTGDYASELFITGDYLVSVATRWADEEYDVDTEYSVCRCWWGKEYTVYTVYDVSDPKKPTETRRVEIEGSPLQSRLIGNNLYFVCNQWIYSVADSGKVSEYDLLPCYVDTAAGSEGVAIQPDDIYYCPGELQNSYLLSGAFDVTGQEPCTPEAVLGSGDTIYMNTNNLYVARTNYNWSEDEFGGVTTNLYRFTVDGAALSYSGNTTVDGYIINQYAMDEYNGCLRLATTSQDKNWNETNNVLVLNDSLQLIGSVTGLAAGETIQSVRFSGDTGYVVTYEQTDPLFVLDLSNPTAPRVTGELKIPGFSEYLHPLGNGLLLGVGRHTTELFSRDEYGNETVEGTTDKGLKISLFDVSDPKNPTELYKTVLGSSWDTYSDLSYNPRSLMVDSANGVIGVPVTSYGDYTSGEFYGYVMVKADRSGIRLLADLGDDSWCYDQRLCYIGQKLYLAAGDTVRVYGRTDYQLKNTFTLTLAERENEYHIMYD